MSNENTTEPQGKPGNNDNGNPVSPSAFEKEKLAVEKTKNNIEQMKIIGDHYRMDIKQVWERSRFFAIINFGTISFVHSEAFDPSKGFTIYIIGFVSSVLWFYVMLSTSKWISVWRNQLYDAEIASGQTVSYFAHERGEINGPWEFLKNLRNIQFKTLKEDWHRIIRPHHTSLVLALAFAVAWGCLLFKAKAKEEDHYNQKITIKAPSATIKISN